MGNLRTDSTEDFPVESRSGDIGYLLIYDGMKEETKRELVSDPSEATEPSDFEWEEHTVPVSWKHYKSTKTEKTSLVEELSELDGFDDVTLLGYWAGRHRTDIHQLELPRFYERLKTADL